MSGEPIPPPANASEDPKTVEYWEARAARLRDEGEVAEFSPDRTSFTWKQKHLYHGTDREGIAEFEFAEESTIGDDAVYFVLSPRLGIGYAKLRGQERRTGTAFLYEAVVQDVSMMNWAEAAAVNLLKPRFLEYCRALVSELDASGYEPFKKKFNLMVSEDIARYALERTIRTLEGEEVHGGNIKSIAQGVPGAFFQAFVTEGGFDGVITVEGGDDTVHTAEPGISVVLYRKDKIVSHSAHEVGGE